MSTRTRTPASVRPLLAGLALLSAAACTDCGPDPVGPDSQIRSVRIVPDEPSLFVGETLQLSADVRDASGVSVPSAAISWSVANSTFASVSASGLLTAHNPGTTSVTASVEGVSDTQVLTVLAEAADEEILFTRSSATDGSWGLFAVQPGGGGLRQAVSRVSELPIASDWLPDGSGFVMDLALDLTYWREYDWTIQKVTDQGRSMIEIAEGRGPAVSPDGSRVAYGHAVGSLWSVELDSGAKTEILNVGIRFNVTTGWVPRMGPDAWVDGWIGFTMEDVATSMSESFLFLTRDDGSEPRTFLTKSGDGMDESGLAFSPDGAWAAFAFGA
ncbi:MAG: Ig-like domain-containing protein, partial [Longimicrobiales bacterium]|nr:Ig-like domain-containing protein [Longimicrobiales bacterium]